MALRRCFARGMNVLTKRKSSTSVEAQKEMLKYWHKNENMKRPLSPYHYYLFGSRLTSNTSITHRISGIGMAIVVPAFGLFCFVKPKPMGELIDKVDFGIPALGTAVKMALAWPIVYHYMNGMRHLSWDFAKGFKMSTINKSGWTAALGSLAVAAALGSIRMPKSVRDRRTK